MGNSNRLKEPFNDSELEWKPQSVGIKNGKPWAMILCYVQARAIQNRLDEVFGAMNWKDEYRFEKNGVICRLSVYCNEKKEWIAKENGSPETDIESFKGGISGSFKRVASSGYGIGRYLYELDTTFAECSMSKQNGWKQAKTKDKQYFYWKVPSSVDSVYKKSQPTQQKPATNTNGTVSSNGSNWKECMGIDGKALCGNKNKAGTGPASYDSSKGYELCYECNKKKKAQQNQQPQEQYSEVPY